MFAKYDPISFISSIEKQFSNDNLVKIIHDDDNELLNILFHCHIENNPCLIGLFITLPNIKNTNSYSKNLPIHYISKKKDQFDLKTTSNAYKNYCIFDFLNEANITPNYKYQIQQFVEQVLFQSFEKFNLEYYYGFRFKSNNIKTYNIIASDIIQLLQPYFYISFSHPIDLNLNLIQNQIQYILLLEKLITEIYSRFKSHSF